MTVRELRRQGRSSPRLHSAPPRGGAGLPPGAHFFLPASALAAACMAFLSSCCFFLKSMSSSVISFFEPPPAFLRMTSFWDLLEVPTGMVSELQGGRTESKGGSLSQKVGGWPG